MVPKIVLFLVTFWTNFGAILGPEICPKLDKFLEGHDSGSGGGESDHPAFYAWSGVRGCYSGDMSSKRKGWI